MKRKCLRQCKYWANEASRNIIIVEIVIIKIKLSNPKNDLSLIAVKLQLNAKIRIEKEIASFPVTKVEIISPILSNICIGVNIFASCLTKCNILSKRFKETLLYLGYLPSIVLVVALGLGLYTQWQYTENDIILGFVIFGFFIFIISFALKYKFNCELLGLILLHICGHVIHVGSLKSTKI
jgi:hypothetical protein